MRAPSATSGEQESICEPSGVCRRGVSGDRSDSGWAAMTQSGSRAAWWGRDYKREVAEQLFVSPLTVNSHPGQSRRTRRPLRPSKNCPPEVTHHSGKIAPSSGVGAPIRCHAGGQPGLHRCSARAARHRERSSQSCHRRPGYTGGRRRSRREDDNSVTNTEDSSAPQGSGGDAGASRTRAADRAESAREAQRLQSRDDRPATRAYHVLETGPVAALRCALRARRAFHRRPRPRGGRPGDPGGPSGTVGSRVA